MIGRKGKWRWETYADDFALLTTVAWCLLGGACGVVFCYALAAWLIVGAGK